MARERTALNDVSRQLELDLVLGQLRPRERLVEDELMARFKAKRHVTRSALLELERVGLVVRPNRGAMVREFTVTEVNDIYDFRAELHRLAVARMPLPLRNDVLSNLTAITHAHRQAIGADNLSEVIVQNNLFHDTLFDQCGNSYITESIRQHAGLSHAIRSIELRPRSSQASR